MLKKLYLCFAILAIFVMTLTPVMADNTSAFPRYVNTFDDETSLDTLTGGAAYYIYDEEIGVDGQSGRLYIPAASDVNTGFAYDDILDLDKKYKISMWVKKEGSEEAKIYGLYRVTDAEVLVTAQGSSANVQGSTLTGSSPWTSGATYIITEEWTKYETIIDMSRSDLFTLGSSSKVKINSYTGFQIRLRGSGAYYVDNLSIEPWYDYTTVESVTVPTGDYVAGEEILPDNRTITTRYSTTIGLGQSSAKSLVAAGSDVTIDDNGRGTAKFAGKDGDMAFMAVSASGSRYVRFQGHDGGYTFREELMDRTVYQVKVRMKAPQFVVDSSISDSKYHVTSDGVVKVKTGTNGKIGEVMTMHITRSASEGAVPVHFTASTVLTADWVDYTGYVYFNPTSPITWADIPNMQVTVPGNAGIFYIDEFSIKPLEYDDDNLALNGDFSLTNGNKAIFYDGSDYTVANDATYGNYLTVTNSAAEKSMPEMLVLAENGDTRSISFYAKGVSAGTITAKVGSEVLTPVASNGLTTGWTKYEYTYTSQSDTLEDLVISSDVNFSIADVKILAPVAPVMNVFTSFDVEGTVAETHTLNISYTYPTNAQASYFVRVSRGDNEKGYLPVYEAETTAPQVADYMITTDDIGKQLLVEVLVIKGGTIEAVKHLTDVVTPAVVIAPAITGWNQSTHKISATVDVINNRANGDTLKLFAVMVLVGDNNKVLNVVESGGISVPTGSTGFIEFDTDDMASVSEGNVNGIAPKAAKLYVWEGTSLFDTTMESYTDEIVYTLQ